MSEDRSRGERPVSREVSGRVQLVDRRIGCRNSKWIVYLDHILDGHGNEVRDFIVVSGQVSRDDLVAGVCILPVLDGQIGLLQYYRHAVAEVLWEAPRGFIDLGEEPSEAAARELAEETGFACDPDEMVPLGHYLPEPSTLQARGSLFVATRCRVGGKPETGEIGLGDLSMFDIDAVAEMASSSKIQDAATLIAFYRYKDWLGHVT